MNGWTWLSLIAAVLGIAWFLMLIRGGEKTKGNDPRYDVIDVRERSNVAVVDVRDRRRFDCCKHCRHTFIPGPGRHSLPCSLCKQAVAV